MQRFDAALHLDSIVNLPSGHYRLPKLRWKSPSHAYKAKRLTPDMQPLQLTTCASCHHPTVRGMLFVGFDRLQTGFAGELWQSSPCAETKPRDLASRKNVGKDSTIIQADRNILCLSRRSGAAGSSEPTAPEKPSPFYVTLTDMTKIVKFFRSFFT